MKKRYATWDELVDYCRRSANPVGRLVLLVFGYREPALLPLSDAICTGLQLANHWQDLAVDLGKDRIYVPEELLSRHGVVEADLFARRKDGGFEPLMAELVSRARGLFAIGRPLCDLVGRDLRFEMRLTWLGGSSILDGIERVGYDIFARRPHHGALGKLALAWRAYRWVRMTETLSSRLTRQSGTSFYHAFRILPAEKREAIYAFYTFCRVVDDCVDEVDGEGEPGLVRWMEEVDRCYAGQPETPLGRELAVAVARFPIPRSAFAEIVEGCRMDLTITRYETEEDLLVYCRRVASAVGLGCIEIFGYEDPVHTRVCSGARHRPAAHQHPERRFGGRGPRPDLPAHGRPAPLRSHRARPSCRRSRRGSRPPTPSPCAARLRGRPG